MTVNCDHCKTRPAQINTGIHKNPAQTALQFRCKGCYEVEQKIAGQQDWRDIVSQQFRETHDMIKRPDETIVNLANRCKIFLAKNGYVFNEH